MSTNDTDTALFTGNLSDLRSTVQTTDLNPNVVQSLNYTKQTTPQDASVYPGTLNDKGIITAFSTEEDVQASAEIGRAHV